jgi:DNA-binding GntR family transcriptional regulator
MRSQKDAKSGAVIGPAGQPRSDTEHWAILDAMRIGDGETACRLLEAHVRAAGQALIERLRVPARGADAA